MHSVNIIPSGEKCGLCREILLDRHRLLAQLAANGHENDLIDRGCIDFGLKGRRQLSADENRMDLGLDATGRPGPDVPSNFRKAEAPDMFAYQMPDVGFALSGDFSRRLFDQSSFSPRKK
jgi:hypothetical protein